MNYIESIEKRCSVRTFDKAKIDEDFLIEIRKKVEQKRKGPFGNNFSFKLVDLNEENSEEIGKMTSYGIVKDAPYYIVGYSVGDDRSIMDYAYCFEELILELTDMNLGTCWLGGTFGRTFVANKINLPQDYVIPAISPLGFPKDKRALADKMVRFFAASKKRKAHHKIFFNCRGEEQITPLVSEELNSPIDEVLDVVRMAPSASNKQPWRLVKQDNLFHFYCDFDRRYNSVVKGFKIQALDMGIALCHFMKAIEELRLGGKLSYADPQLKIVDWNYIISWKFAN